MSPLVFITVVLLVWVLFLTWWLINQEVRLRAQQQVQMRIQRDVGLLERQVLSLQDRAHVHHGSTRSHL